MIPNQRSITYINDYPDPISSHFSDTISSSSVNLSISNEQSMLNKPNDLNIDSMNTKSISFFYTNFRNIVNKFQQFQSLVYSKSFDIIGLTETWLSDSIFNNEILPSNFTMYRQDCQSRGGGVLMAVNDKISSQKLPLSANLNLPYPVTMCTVYMYTLLLTITKPCLIFFQI